MRSPTVLAAVCAATLAAPPAPAQSPRFRVLNEQVPPGTGKVIRAVDLDLDGDADLLTTGRVLVNDGAERYAIGPAMPSGLALVVDPPSVAAGDLNGDSFPDLVGAAWPWAGVAFNNGGTLASFFPFAAGVGAPSVYARTVAMADVDGDGDLDVFVTSFAWAATIPQTSLPLQPRLFLNNGTGALTEATATRLPVMNVFGDVVEIVDFDADGDADLFLARTTSSPNPTTPANAYSLLLLNAGGGFFGAPIVVPGPGTPANAAAGDVNGDGKPDVVYSPVESSTVSPAGSSGVALNLGGGAFGPFVSTPLPAARVLLRDLNGDGLAEAIRSSAAGVTIHAVAPSGAIGAATQSVAVSSAVTVAHDFDGDGDADLCVDGGNRKTLVFDDATGTLVPVEGHLRVPAGSGQRVVGDVDGDGDVDFAWVPAAAAGAPLQVAFNDGRGNLQPGAFCGGACPVVVGASRLMPLDFDGDGILDPWVASTFSNTLPTAGSDVLYRGNGAGWTQAATLAGPDETATVIEGDLDGDSDRDLVVIRHAAAGGLGPAPSLVLFNQGPAGFGPPLPISPPLTGLDGVLLDADGDGDLDLVETVAAALGATSVLFQNDGAGGFTQAAGGGLPSAITGAIFAGDLDGDGDGDLVMDAQIALNGGAGSFAPGPPLPSGTWAVALFDADADGDLDLLQQGILSGTSTTWLLRNAGGTFPTSEVVGPAWDFGPHADFDRDGDQDLVGPGPLVYVNTTRQIARGSTVRPGQNAVVELYGPPGAPWMLFAAQGPANLAVPPWGTVFIDPATAFLVASGVFTTTGTAAFTTLVPSTPAVVGLSAHLQGGLPAQQRLTNLEILTVLGL